MGIDTIIEENSILAGLDAGFSEEMEYRSAGLDYQCLSDEGTEIDSEFDKIEYEFLAVPPVSMEEIKISSDEMKRICTENEIREVGSGDEEINASDTKMDLNPDNPSDTTLVEAVSTADKVTERESTIGKLQTEMIEDIFQCTSSIPAEMQFEIKDIEQEGSRQSSQVYENDKIDVLSTSHESLSSSSPYGGASKIELSQSHSPATTFQDSSKSTPFARIIFAKHSDEMKPKANSEGKNDGKEGLVEFLLKSGLFSTG